MKTFKLITTICCIFILLNADAQLNGGTIVSPLYSPNGYPVYYCNNQHPATMNNGLSAYNGTPPLHYMWEWRQNSSAWNSLLNSDSVALVIPTSLYSPNSKEFRRRVTDANGATAYSNSVVMKKCDFRTGGSIAFDGPRLNTTQIFMTVGYTPPKIKSTGEAEEFNSYVMDYDWMIQPVGASNYTPFYVPTYPIQPQTSLIAGGVNYIRRGYSEQCYCPNDNGSLSNPLNIQFVQSNIFDPGTIHSNVSSATLGNTINFNNSTPASAGAAPYVYQWQSSLDGITWTDIPGATGVTYQETLTAHKYFRRRAWDIGDRIVFTNSKYLKTISNIGSFYNYNCRSFTLNNVSGSSAWFDITDTVGNVIASVNPNGLDLGTITTTMKHFGFSVDDIPMSNLIPYMPRHFEISSSTYGSSNFPSPVGVRLYYKNSEFSNFKVKLNDPLLTKADLRISHYHGANQDCDVNNNTPGGTVEITPTKGTFADGFYLQFNVNSFSEFDAVSKNLPLPVSWLNFTGEYKNEQVLLKWSVTNQVNNKGFTIQRSINGINYEDVGWVNANNAASQVEYSFIDRNPSGKILYYRLRQVDNDNRAKYSNTITVRTNGRSKFVVQPNPVTNNWFVVQASTTEAIHYKIVNTSGQVVLTGTTSNNAKVGVEQLSKGVYTLQLCTSTDVQVIKLMIL